MKTAGGKLVVISTRTLWLPLIITTERDKAGEGNLNPITWNEVFIGSLLSRPKPSRECESLPVVSLWHRVILSTRLRVTVVSLSLHSSFCFNASADCIFIMTKPGGGLYLKFLYHYCREASKVPGLMPEIGRYAGGPDNCSLAWREMIISAF